MEMSHAILTHRLVVEPERHPRGEDDDDGGEVDGEEVVGDLTLEGHVHRQAAVLPWNRQKKNGE